MTAISTSGHPALRRTRTGCPLDAKRCKWHVVGVRCAAPIGTNEIWRAIWLRWLDHLLAHRVKETLLPRGFLSPPRNGFKNRTHHPTRRRRALRSHPESLDSNHRLSPRPLHKTMSGPGEKGHSGRPGQKNPELIRSAFFGGDDKAPHPSGTMKRGMKRGVRAKPEGLRGTQDEVAPYTYLTRWSWRIRRL